MDSELLQELHRLNDEIERKERLTKKKEPAKSEKSTHPDHP